MRTHGRTNTYLEGQKQHRTNTAICSEKETEKKQILVQRKKIDRTINNFKRKEEKLRTNTDFRSKEET